MVVTGCIVDDDDEDLDGTLAPPKAMPKMTPEQILVMKDPLAVVWTMHRFLMPNSRATRS